jgi:hypothetical protein
VVFYVLVQHAGPGRAVFRPEIDAVRDVQVQEQVVTGEQFIRVMLVRVLHGGYLVPDDGQM